MFTLQKTGSVQMEKKKFFCSKNRDKREIHKRKVIEW